MHIDQIQVGFRYRKDLGDLRTLADSIAEVGLLHPVVVTPEGRLIAGQRRLEACRQLGLTEVPVTVVDLLPSRQRRGSREPRPQRPLPSEIVALKRAIEPLERRARVSGRHPSGPLSSRHCGGMSGGRPRQDSPLLGVGRTTIDRAEAVLEAAEEDPDEFGHLVEQMDRSGKVAVLIAGSQFYSRPRS